MNKPPKGDPQRPLFVATRSTRVLGIIYLLIGGVIFSLIVWRFRRVSAVNLLEPILATHAMILILPGVLHILFSVFMHRRQFWAIVAALVLASIQVVVLMLAIAGMLAQIFFGVGFDLGMLVDGSVAGCFLAAFIVLIVQLARSFPSLKADSTQFGRGFVPVLMAQAEPSNDEQRTTSH